MRTLHFFSKNYKFVKFLWSGVGWWTVEWLGWVVWMGIQAWITLWVARMKRMWRRWLKRSHVVWRWSTDRGKFWPAPTFTLPLRRQSEVGPWVVPLDVPIRTTRYPTIQQANSRSDLGSNFGGWTTSRTENRNVNALLKLESYTCLTTYKVARRQNLPHSTSFQLTKTCDPPNPLPHIWHCSPPTTTTLPDFIFCYASPYL